MQWWHLSRSRHLEVSTGGRWYIALTLLVGIAAVNSGNNVIYLVESLLLSMLIFSGVLSEFAVRGVEVSRRVGRAIAGKSVPDRIDIYNSSKFPVFCLEISEWRGNVFHPIAFLPHIAAKERITINSAQIINQRGKRHWDGYAVATSFPFGFGRKSRMIKFPGERIVWPHGEKDHRLGVEKTKLNSAEYLEGELRELSQEEDMRLIHWPTTMRRGGLVGRVRDYGKEPILVELLVRAGDPSFEKKISKAAGCFYSAHSTARVLLIKTENNSKTINGRSAALDALAVLESTSI